MENAIGKLFHSLALGAALFIPCAVEAQDPVVYKVQGLHVADHLGWDVAVLDDVDGDGVKDFVASTPFGNRAPNDQGSYGYVLLFSGKTGQQLRRWQGAGPLDRFGLDLVLYRDVDGDGKREFLTRSYPSWIHVLSPMKNETLRSFAVFSRPQAQNPYATLHVADLDGDRIEDVIVADFDYNLKQFAGDVGVGIGLVVAISGATERWMWVTHEEEPESAFAYSAAVIRDVDGDGLSDLVVGEPGRSTDNEGNYRPAKGRVHILRGKTGEFLRTIDDDPGAFLGRTMANVGDLDGDSFDELMVSSQGYARDRGINQGWVGVFSTRTWKTIHQFVGVEGNLASPYYHGDQLGYQLSSAGDVDLDGVPDLLIAANKIHPSPDFTYGQLDLRSGRTGKLLASYQERQDLDQWIKALARLDDVDGDGRPEFLIGAPWLHLYDRSQPVGGDVGRGEVAVVRYEPHEPRFLRGDVNGDGRMNIADAVSILRKLYYGIEDGDCLRAYDVYGDDQISVNDFIRTMSFLFFGGYAPSPPFPECGRFGGLRQTPLSCRSPSCANESD